MPKFLCKDGASRESGAISILFLFVAVFILGALSFSFLIGQLIEKRVANDLAADAGAFAMASQSSQGLNFIAANNLAIAGTIHQATALQLFADEIIIFTAMAMAKKEDMMSGIPESKREKMQRIYNATSPVAKLYLDSARGMTTLNGWLQAAYPYQAIPRGIQVALANQPGAIAVPFITPSASPNPPSANASGGFKARLKSLLQLKSSFQMSYRGLETLSGADSFCLSLRASKALGKKQHSYEEWFGDTGIPLLKQVKGIVSALSSGVSTASKLLGGPAVGYSDCGFGENQDESTGSKLKGDAITVNPIIRSVLTGVLSGRTTVVPTPQIQTKPESRQAMEDAWKEAQKDHKDIDLGPVPENPTPAAEAELCQRPNVFCAFPKPQATADQLEKELNAKVTCTGPSPLDAVWEKGDKFEGGVFQTVLLTSIPQGNGVCVNEVLEPKGVLETYKVSNREFKLKQIRYYCHGHIFFKWGGYAGLDAHNSNPLSAFIPRPEGFGDVNRDDFCPNFKATIGYGVGEELIYKAHVDLSLTRPFLDSVLRNLEVNFETGDSPFQPKRGTFRILSRLMECSKTGKQPACTNDQGELINKDKFVFRVGPPSDLKWICPVIDALRLKPGQPVPGNYAAEVETKLRDWHNQRINAIDCSAYEQYKLAPPLRPGKSDTNFCTSSSYMCWQTNWDKIMGQNEDFGINFTVPTPMNNNGTETMLEQSLKYTMLLINPLHIKDNDKGSGNCPPALLEELKLGPSGEALKVCDYKPLANFVSQKIEVNQPQPSGAPALPVDSNLASGGFLRSFAEMESTQPRMWTVAQTRIVFQPAAAGGPVMPVANSKAKAHTMFWPAWKPQMMPSRLMSYLLPPVLAVFFED